jgi:hypothetical protein
MKATILLTKRPASDHYQPRVSSHPLTIITMKTISTPIFALYLMLLVSAASADKCGSNWRSIKSRLRDAQKKWAKKAPSTSDYQYSLEKICFCAPVYRGPHTLQVVGGVVQANATDEFAQQMPTVQGMFDLVYENCVKDCPTSGAAACTVRFDKKYGFVNYMYIDVSAHVKDEEFGYAVTNMTFSEN